MNNTLPYLSPVSTLIKTTKPQRHMLKTAAHNVCDYSDFHFINYLQLNQTLSTVECGTQYIVGGNGIVWGKLLSSLDNMKVCVSPHMKMTSTSGGH